MALELQVEGRNEKKPNKQTNTARKSTERLFGYQVQWKKWRNTVILSIASCLRISANKSINTFSDVWKVPFENLSAFRETKYFCAVYDYAERQTLAKAVAIQK